MRRTTRRDAGVRAITGLIAPLALIACASLMACDRGTEPDAQRVRDDGRDAGARSAADVPRVLVGAGDIASCWWFADAATGRILDTIPGTVFTVGDNVYQNGTARQFRNCYDPVWGRVRDRTYPSIGNHDARTNDGAAYYDYFGDRAGKRGEGWYSYDLGAWHIIVYNSVVDISAESPQMAWVKRDLAAHASTRCILAYGHHPRFSSGKLLTISRMKPLWDVLYAGGVDVVLAGHEHFYERFAPQTPDGRLDPERGIRQFIVGTGGAPFYRVKRLAKNSEVAMRSHGVLKLTLRADRYDWEFVPVRADPSADRGSALCSAARPL